MDELVEPVSAEQLLRIQRDLAVSLGASTELQPALDIVLDAMVRLPFFDCGGIYLVDRATGDLDLVTHRNVSASFAAAVGHYDADTTSARLVQQGRAVYQRYSSFAEAVDPVRSAEGLRSVAVLPILHEQRVLAVLNLASRTLDDVPPAARDAAEAIAAQLGATLARIQAEDDLRASEVRFRTVFDHAGVGIGFSDLAGRLLEANPALQAILGRPAAAIIGRRVQDFTHPDDVGEELQAMRELRAEKPGAAMVLEKRFLRPDGEVVLVRLTASLVPDGAGRPMAAVGLVEDITARRQSQALLQTQRDLAVTLSATSELAHALDAVLAATSDIEGIDAGGIYLVDGRHGGLRMVARRGIEATSAARVAEFAPGTPLARLAAAGRPVYFTRGAPASEAAVRFRAEEGITADALLPVWHRGRVVALMAVGSHSLPDIPIGARVGLEGIAAQIGGVIARADADALLQESRRNLQTLFEKVGDLVLVFAEDGPILEWNPVLERRLGYPPERLQRMAVTELYPPAQRAELAARVADAIAGASEVFGLPMLSRGGRPIPVETRVTRGRWGDRDVLFAISREAGSRVSVATDDLP